MGDPMKVIKYVFTSGFVMKRSSHDRHAPQRPQCWSVLTMPVNGGNGSKLPLPKPVALGKGIREEAGETSQRQRRRDRRSIVARDGSAADARGTLLISSHLPMNRRHMIRAGAAASHSSSC